MFILDNLFIKQPIKGVIRLSRFLEDQAQQQYYDTNLIRQELMRLQTQFEMDEISEEEYDQKEEALLERLEEAQQKPSSPG